jgi:NADPH:quinone reductase-like Zn-dependent oxidoreductase
MTKITGKIPAVMRAVLLTDYGGPEKLVYRTDVPTPTPEPGEVLIRVGACGVNNTDLWTREGAYGSDADPTRKSAWRRGAMPFPRIQGADIAGMIVAVGDGVPEERLGQRVLVDPVLYTGDDANLFDTAFMGSERDGGFAEYTTAPAVNVHVMRSTLSDAELATFPTAYITAEHMLNRAQVREGETILITGASGGVGSALLQLARLRGAITIALAGAGKETLVLQLGADKVVSRHADDLYQTVMETTGGQFVDVVADVAGGPMFPELLRLLVKGGRYVAAGAIAGPMVTLDLRTVYLKHLVLIGSTLGTHQEFADLVTLIESGKLRPLLAKTFPLEQLRAAQQFFAEKQFLGKLVIVP